MSDAEDVLVGQLAWAGAPRPEREYVFSPPGSLTPTGRPHRWRFDLAWPDRRLALEVEGGVWTTGRHTSGSGFEADCRKYNEAALEGWAVLRVTTNMIRRGEALDLALRALQRPRP